MGLLNNLFGIPPRRKTIQESPGVTREEHLEVVNSLLEKNRQIQESEGLMALKLEDYQWSPINGWRKDDGFSLGTIQDEADHCRALYAVNPLIKKAVTARVGMVHGRGHRIVVRDTGEVSAAVQRTIDMNERKIFGPVARARLEAELSTSGNVFAISEANKEAVVVPIQQISGYVTDVEDPTRVLYWKRSYSTSVMDMDTGLDRVETVEEYIPATGNNTPVNTIGDVPVRVKARMVHIAANRQEGWVLGLPDIFAAKFWSKGHKEMFEAGHEFALAQGEFAAKVTGGSGLGSQMAASRLADSPRRDSDTGEVIGYGSTFVGSGSMDLQLMGKMGSGVDFKSYDRIVGLIAVGTGVPLKVILGESDSEETSLEQTTVDDMKLRQKLWSEFYEDMFWGVKVKVIWPRIKQETLYRVQQALEIANRSNTLSADEKRLVAIEAFGLEGDAQSIPDIMDHPDVQVYLAKKKIDLEYAPLIAEAEGQSDDSDDLSRATVNDQGNDQKLGKLSDGSDAHEARDRGEQEHTRN